jgi:hypothetical protein
MQHLPDDVKYLISNYFSLEEIPFLMTLDFFRSTLNSQRCWKVWWETQIGGETEDYAEGVKNILLRSDEKDFLFYCEEHNHHLYFATLLKKKSPQLYIIYDLYMRTKYQTIKDVLTKHAGGESQMNRIIRMYSGPIVCTGPTGAVGPTGSAGTPSLMGTTGIGLSGIRGTTLGYAGPVGLVGATGAIGPVGVAGSSSMFWGSPTGPVGMRGVD